MKKTTKNEIMVVENTTVENANFAVVYDILKDTPANKNLLRNAMNKAGFYCTVKTKNTTDYATLTPNDFYHQFIDGTRVLLNAKRTKMQIWTNAELVKAGIFDNLTTDFSNCNDSGYRNCKSTMTIPFTVDTVNILMSILVDNNHLNVL